MTPLLAVNNLHKEYNGIPILQDVTMQLHDGEILGIWGQNASAKTTLARLLCGELQPDSGEMRLRGKPLKLRNVTVAKKMGVSAIFGDVELVDPLTVAENLLLGNMRRFGCGLTRNLISPKIMNKAALELCASHGISLDVTTCARTLSLPERQLVNLLKVIAYQPRILIVDDAFSALDGEELASAYRILKEISQKGTTIVFLSHNYKQLQAVCSSLVKIEDGCLSEQYLPDDFAANCLPKAEKGKKTIPKLHTVKKEVSFACRNLYYRQVIKNISFDLHYGEVLGILGASNSGRSTLARLLCGDLPRDLGKFYWEDKPLDIRNPRSALKQHIALMLDDSNRYSLLPNADLTSNITLSNHVLQSYPAGLMIPRRAERAKAEKIADHLGIRYASMRQKARQISSSSKKMLILGRWLSAGCQVFLLDEPTLRLDAPGRLHIYNVMNELSRQGKSVILFTSDIDEVLGICDRVLTLCDGTINGEFKTNEADYNDLYAKIFH